MVFGAALRHCARGVRGRLLRHGAENNRRARPVRHFGYVSNLRPVRRTVENGHPDYSAQIAGGVNFHFRYAYRDRPGSGQAGRVGP